MVITDKANPETHLYNMMTQRDFPQMARFRTHIDDRLVGMDWDGEEKYWIEEDRNSGLEFYSKLHDDIVVGVDQGDEVAEFLSDHLGTGARLIKVAGSFKRLAQQTYVKSDSPVNYQDGYSINWFTEASIEELSQRMKEEIPWQIFRPQIVVGGLPAQYEHQIFEAEINGVRFLNAKPCGRCVVTTINHETGEKARNTLKDLGKYKLWINPQGEKKVIFAENSLIYADGDIAVGDPLHILSLRDPPLKFEVR